MSKSQLEAMITEQHHQTELLQDRPYHQALGVLLNTPEAVYMGPNMRSFGHHGIGGSLGFGDPDAHLGFSYACNKMHAVGTNGPRARAADRRALPLRALIARTQWGTNGDIPDFRPSTSSIGCAESRLVDAGSKSGMSPLAPFTAPPCPERRRRLSLSRARFRAGIGSTRRRTARTRS